VVWKLIWQSLGGWLSVIATWDFGNTFASDFSGMHSLFPCSIPAGYFSDMHFVFPCLDPAAIHHACIFSAGL
jgi:hypothetical protein